MTETIDRAAWLEERRSFIGGSDVPVVLGLKGSRLRLFLEKTGQLTDDREPTKAQRRGLRLERYIADAWGELTGDPVVRTQVVARHPAMPYAGCTLDAITAAGRIVEFKTSGSFGPVQKVDGPDDFEALPEAWAAQGAHQLLVTGHADLWWGVVTPDLELNVIGPWPRPEPLIAIISREVQDFWARHVLAGIPPDEIEPGDADALARAFRGDTGDILELDDDHEEWAIRYQELGREIRERERERDILRGRLLLALRDAAGAVGPGGWTLRRKVIESHHEAREAETRTQVRLFVAEPKA